MNRKISITPNIASEMTPAELLEVKEIARGFEVYYGEKPPADTEVLYGMPEINFLQAAKELRWHHLPFSGVGDYGNLNNYANKKVTLTNARRVYGKTVAEHILAMVLALLRRLPLYEEQKAAKIWRRADDAYELSSSSVFVLGAGDLGGNTGELFSKMGCKVSLVRRNILQKPEWAKEIFTLSMLYDVLPRADIIINCLPDTIQTKGLFSSQVFAKMKKTAIFVNVGRGTAVDEIALCTALQEKQIWGAAIDVALEEPLPKNSPMWDTPNLIISPHSAAHCPDTFSRNNKLFLDLLVRYVNNRTLYNKVDFLLGF